MDVKRLTLVLIQFWNVFCCSTLGGSKESNHGFPDIGRKDVDDIFAKAFVAVVRNSMAMGRDGVSIVKYRGKTRIYDQDRAGYSPLRCDGVIGKPHLGQRLCYGELVLEEFDPCYPAHDFHWNASATTVCFTDSPWSFDYERGPCYGKEYPLEKLQRKCGPNWLDESVDVYYAPLPSGGTDLIASLPSSNRWLRCMNEDHCRFTYRSQFMCF